MKSMLVLFVALGVLGPAPEENGAREAEPPEDVAAGASAAEATSQGDPAGADEVQATQTQDDTASQPEPRPSEDEGVPPTDLLDDSAPTAEESVPPDDASVITVDRDALEPESPPPGAIRDGLRIDLVPSDGRKLELFRVDPQAGDSAVGRIDGIPFVRVCASPCDEPIDAVEGDEFFVAGPDLMPSPRFYLDEYEESARLDVRPGPKPVRLAGFGLTVSGALLIPAGILMAVAAPWGKAGDAAGYASIGVGGASLIGGIVLLLRGRTKVQVASGR